MKMNNMSIVLAILFGLHVAQSRRVALVFPEVTEDDNYNLLRVEHIVTTVIIWILCGGFLVINNAGFFQELCGNSGCLGHVGFLQPSALRTLQKIMRFSITGGFFTLAWGLWTDNSTTMRVSAYCIIFGLAVSIIEDILSPCGNIHAVLVRLIERWTLSTPIQATT